MDQGKRKLRRIRLVCSLPVTDRDTGEQLGFLEDITVEGMRVKGPSFLETGRIVHASLQLPEEIECRTEVELDARCAWSAQSDTPGLYDAGFMFIDTPWEATEIIDTLIRKFQR